MHWCRVSRHAVLVRHASGVSAARFAASGAMVAARTKTSSRTRGGLPFTGAGAAKRRSSRVLVSSRSACAAAARAAAVSASDCRALRALEALA